MIQGDVAQNESSDETWETHLFFQVRNLRIITTPNMQLTDKNINNCYRVCIFVFENYQTRIANRQKRN